MSEKQLDVLKIVNSRRHSWRWHKVCRNICRDKKSMKESVVNLLDWNKTNNVSQLFASLNFRTSYLPEGRFGGLTTKISTNLLTYKDPSREAVRCAMQMCNADVHCRCAMQMCHADVPCRCAMQVPVVAPVAEVPGGRLTDDGSVWLFLNYWASPELRRQYAHVERRVEFLG